MPVGTRASVTGLTAQELRELGAEMILGNTYHLALRPGPEAMRQLGGMHRFMGWDRGILTDSGGFQIFSPNPKVDDDGAILHAFPALRPTTAALPAEQAATPAWLQPVPRPQFAGNPSGRNAVIIGTWAFVVALATGAGASTGAARISAGFAASSRAPRVSANTASL